MDSNSSGAAKGLREERSRIEMAIGESGVPGIGEFPVVKREQRELLWEELRQHQGTR